MHIFKTIGCFFHPSRSAACIIDRDDYVARFETRIEKALVARLVGTYDKAYADAYRSAYAEGSKMARTHLIAHLKAGGLKIPEGIE